MTPKEEEHVARHMLLFLRSFSSCSTPTIDIEPFLYKVRELAQGDTDCRNRHTKTHHDNQNDSLFTGRRSQEPRREVSPDTSAY